MTLSLISSVHGEVDWSARAALLRVIYVSFNFTYLLYSGGTTPRGQPPQASTVHDRQSITFNSTDTPKPSAERFMNQVFRWVMMAYMCVCDTMCACVTLCVRACVTLCVRVPVSTCRVWWIELTLNALVCIFLSAPPLVPACLLIFILLLFPSYCYRCSCSVYGTTILFTSALKKSNSSHIWPSLIQT